MTLVVLFIFGTIVGSFLNVCIFRLPRGKSIILPGSRCPNCNQALKIWDLFPILSYLFLWGRCRFCGASISFRYPLVEFLTGTIYAGLFYSFGLGIDFVFYAFLFSVFVIVFFVDLEFQIIPDRLTYLGIGAGLIYNLVKGQILASLIGLTVGFGLLWAVRRLAAHYYQQEAMGEGDVYFAALMGAVLGPPNLFLALFLACFLGSILGLILLLQKRAGMRSAIPFGPLLVLGTAITALFGNRIWQFYIGA
jgi:leader peptidase (prepilin peptidase)/N-methyltransferase